MVETDRLNIIPLTLVQLELYLQGKGKLEKKFRLSDTVRSVAFGVKQRVTKFILPKMKLSTGENYLFYTFWIVIEKSSNTIVAELGFKGEPDEIGDIEIGYGTFADQRNKGIMTEAVGAMIGWARAQRNIKVILAETDKQNQASIRVVEKNNFECFRQEGKMLWWKISVK